MNITEYLIKTEFSKQGELRRSLLAAFYNFRIDGLTSFTIQQLSSVLETLGYARPNPSRLRANLKKSKMFVSIANSDRFRIHPATIETLDIEFPELSKKTEEIVSFNSVLPESLLQKDRAYIKSLIKQINASYENNIFDGCAVLMRRLLEILLILAYQELQIASLIQDSSGNFKLLNAIIDDAKINTKLGLSRNTRENLDGFRKLGNFSAHKIYYNADRKTIESAILDFKAAIEELLYKSGLRT